MKILSIQDIRKFAPCYEPTRHGDEDWTGTAVDVLLTPGVPLYDALWLVLRPEIIEESVLATFQNACGGGVDAFQAALTQYTEAPLEEKEAVKSKQLSLLLSLLSPT